MTKELDALQMVVDYAILSAGEYWEKYDCHDCEPYHHMLKAVQVAITAAPACDHGISINAQCEQCNTENAHLYPPAPCACGGSCACGDDDDT